MWLTFAKTKLAEKIYMYHGTSSDNILQILSQGLHDNTKKIWDETKGQREREPSLQSLPGTYLTTNLTTATIAGYNAGKETDEGAIIITSIETQSPSIVTDEDNLNEMDIYIQACNVHSVNPLYELTENFPNIQHTINRFMELIKSSFPKIENQPQLQQHIQNSAENLIKLRITLAAAIKKDIDAKGAYMPNIYREFPELLELDRKEIENQFRQEYDNFIKKMHRLTTLMETDNLFFNVRSTEPLSFKGKNKIVAVVKWERTEDFFTQYKTLFCSDTNALHQLIKDILHKKGDSFKLTDQNGNTLYDKPSEHKLDKSSPICYPQHMNQETFQPSKAWNDLVTHKTTKRVTLAGKQICVTPHEEQLIPLSTQFGNADKIQQKGTNVRSLYLGPSGTFFEIPPHSHDATAQQILQKKQIDQTRTSNLLSQASGILRLQLRNPGIAGTIEMSNPPNKKQLNAIKEIYQLTPDQTFQFDLRYKGQRIGEVNSLQELILFVNNFNPKQPTNSTTIPEHKRKLMEFFGK